MAFHVIIIRYSCLCQQCYFFNIPVNNTAMLGVCVGRWGAKHKYRSSINRQDCMHRLRSWRDLIDLHGLLLDIDDVVVSALPLLGEDGQRVQALRLLHHHELVAALVLLALLQHQLADGAPGLMLLGHLQSLKDSGYYTAR